MNVLKPFDDCFLSNEDAIRDLEDCVVVSDVDLDDIVTGDGFEVVRNDYDAVNVVVQGYGFERLRVDEGLRLVESRVSYLNLYRMGLEHLSGEIGKLDRLEELNLVDNELSVLPVEIGNLINLHSLDLGYNILSVLPVEIGNLVKLEGLYLSGNGLSVLPEELCGLPNLKWFWVNNNSLSDYSVVDKLRKKGVGGDT